MDCEDPVKDPVEDRLGVDDLVKTLGECVGSGHGVGVGVLLKLPLLEPHSEGTPEKLPGLVAERSWVRVPVVHPHWVGVRVEVGEWEGDGDSLAPALGVAQGLDPVAHSEADTLPRALTVELLDMQVVVVKEVLRLAWPLKEPLLDTLGVRLPGKAVREATMDRDTRLGVSLPPSSVCVSTALLEAVDPRVCDCTGD